MLTAGDLIGERYRLTDRIAGGGMGDVWKARDERLGRVVAVKILDHRTVAHPGFGARFRHEARTMATLHHPGVVDVYDYGEGRDGDRTSLAYLVMAHVDGEPLSDMIAQAGRLDAEKTMAVVAQTARALEGAHGAGVVHRDVKPANLLVCPDGKVVLVDFGVARSADTTALTGVNEVVGTALYMAPEQVSKGAITPATDMYSLGVVAYQCLAGRPPFSGDNALQVAMRHLDEDPPPLPDDVPERVRALVLRAMAKDPADRFPSAAAMARAAELATGQPRGGDPAPVGSGTTAALPVVGDPTVAVGAQAANGGSATAAGYRPGVAGPRRLGDTDPDIGYGGYPPSPAGIPGDGRGRRRTAVIVGAVLAGLLAVVVALAFADVFGGGGSPGPSTVTNSPGGSGEGGVGPAGSPSVRPGGQPGASPGDDEGGDDDPTSGPSPSTGPTGDPAPTGEPEPTEPAPTEPAPTDPPDDDGSLPTLPPVGGGGGGEDPGTGGDTETNTTG